MSREAVTHLCALLNEDLQQMGFGGHPLLVALKVTVALNLYTSASFQGPTGDLCGVTQSAVHRCIREVTDALYRRAGDHVRFRTDPERQAQRVIGFASIAGFPQLVCDHRKRFIQVYAHFPDNCHDAFILCQPQVPLLFTELAQIEGWILGDKGYPLQTWLLTTLRNTTSDAKERYNACHRSTRATIKQAIDMLKLRFRCLDKSGGALQYAPERVACLISVCCALHNFALNRGEALQDEERREQDSSSDDKDAEGLQQEMRMGGRTASWQRL
ncbi:putative nuclease HARBI1 [Heterodontus francisci]|uniref:putative nuclease HARBI1 n=1 Tax=Heterodontus francisci TaxID=7792 RepID=UPI00355C0072